VRRYASVVYAIVVCLSVTLQYCIKMAKLRMTQIMPHIKPRDSSFLMLKIMMKFEPFLLKSNTKSYVLY